jgi:molybdate transport system substrate-binding protein
MQSVLWLLAGTVLAVATSVGPVEPDTGARAAQRGTLVVAAASSLGDVATELVDAFAATGQPRPRLNIGGSSFLARQIVQGAPADVFISADEA